MVHFNGTGYVRMNVMTVLDIPMKLGEFTGQNLLLLRGTTTL